MLGKCKVSSSKGMQVNKYHAGEAPSKNCLLFFYRIPMNATPKVGDSK